MLIEAFSEIQGLALIAANVNPEPAKKSGFPLAFTSKEDSGPKTAAKLIGKTTLKAVFPPNSKELDSIRKRIKKGCSVEESLLHGFARRGRTSVVESLLATGKCDIDRKNEKGLPPLIIAIHHGHADMVQLLLDKGADKEATFEDCTALIEAAAQNNEAMVNMLLEKGAKPEAKTTNGNTALHV
jgi:Ankyrin repeats (3 copies)